MAPPAGARADAFKLVSAVFTRWHSILHTQTGSSLLILLGSLQAMREDLERCVLVISPMPHDGYLAYRGHNPPGRIYTLSGR